MPDEITFTLKLCSIRDFLAYSTTPTDAIKEVDLYSTTVVPAYVRPMADSARGHLRLCVDDPAAFAFYELGADYEITIRRV